jgi:uncharacterized membrane protein
VAGVEEVEGRTGVARVEAFSDGVLAIIITIMVLEMHAPEEPGLSALWHLWPTFFAYVVSYNYVAIYWVNHHRLFTHARFVTNGLLWSNIVLLFALSMIPFSTAYLGKHFGDPLASALYATSLFVPALAFFWLQRVIRRTGSGDVRALAYHRATKRKGVVSSLAYATAIPLGLVAPYAGVTLAGLIGLFWLLPWSPLEGLFADRQESP